MSPPRRVLEPIDDESFVEIPPPLPPDPDAGDLEHLEGAGAEWRWACYRRLTTDERLRYGGADRVLLTRINGAINVMDFQREWGGGTFEFWGTISGQKGLRKKEIISLIGPIRNLNPPAEAAAIASNGGGGELAKILERIETRLNTPPAPATPPPPPPDPMAQIAVMVGLVKAIMDVIPHPPPAPPAPATTPMDELFKAVNLGIDIQAKATGGNPESDGLAIAKIVMPSLEKLGSAILSRRPPPAQRTARPAEASVVEEPPPTPAPAPAPPPTPAAATPDEEAAARWTTLIGSLARALEQQVEPQDFASTVSDIMLESEVDGLCKAPDAAVIGELAQGPAVFRYPVLNTPAAHQYIAAVLKELRAAGEPEPTASD